jgi:hypothetical protein
MEAEAELAGAGLAAPGDAGAGRQVARAVGEFARRFEGDFKTGDEGFGGDEAEAFAGVVQGGGNDEASGSAGFIDPEADFGLVGEGGPAPGAAVRDGGFRHGGLFGRRWGIERENRDRVVVEIGKRWW